MENTEQISGHQQPLQKSNSYLIQLERYTNDLIQSTILLNSYNYEPKTKELFELKTILKEKFKQILQVNSSIKQEIHQKSTDSKEVVLKIKNQIKNLDQLHREIKKYCVLTQTESE